MRPKKIRWIQCPPGARCFQPEHASAKKRPAVLLTLDEFEAVRLCDLEGRNQEDAASRMKVHRSTVSRILKAARKKIADALVRIKTIRIEGGCCAIAGEE